MGAPAVSSVGAISCRRGCSGSRQEGAPLHVIAGAPDCGQTPNGVVSSTLDPLCSCHGISARSGSDTASRPPLNRSTRQIVSGENVDAACE